MNAMAELTRALDFHKAGNFAEAERLYRRVLGFEPQNVDALHLLGIARMQLGDNTGSVDFIKQAIAINPKQAVFYSSLAQAYEAAHLPSEAFAAYRQSAEAAPYDVQAQLTAAHAATRFGDPALAVAFLQKALRLAPQNATIHCDICGAYVTAGRLTDAIQAGQTAVTLDPQLAEAYANLGLAQGRAGDRVAAEASLRTAQVLKPEDAGVVGLLVKAMNDNSVGTPSDRVELCRTYVRLEKGTVSSRALLARALAEVGNLDEVHEAIDLFAALATERPDDADLMVRLVSAHRKLGETTAAEAAAHRLVAAHPTYPRSRVLLGAALEAQGRLDDAGAVYQAAIDADRSNSEAWHSLLYVSLLSDKLTPPEQMALHVKWAAENLAKPEAAAPAPPAAARADDKLRVAYLSADFVAHPVGFFIAGVLKGHDKSKVHVTALHNLLRTDDVSRWLASFCDQFAAVGALNDRELADYIREQQFDVLIDLSGHTGNNRQQMLPMLTTPVVVNYLGYPGTTANPAVQYRITDAWADPAGKADAWHTEKLVRLPRTFLCFTPAQDVPPVAPVPSSSGKPFTFGSFNRISKMTPAAVKLFAAIMKGVPGSRLILKGEFADAMVKDRYVAQFAAEGIEADRLTALPTDRDGGEHFRRYGDVDVAIDPYPYHGTTTTCEALWQGVPVISLIGPSHVSRVGLSIANAIGLPELCGNTVEECVAEARKLAGDPKRLAELRSTMRDRMSKSPLMDGKGLAEALEVEYRKMLAAAK